MGVSIQNGGDLAAGDAVAGAVGLEPSVAADAPDNVVGGGFDGIAQKNILFAREQCEVEHAHAGGAPSRAGREQNGGGLSAADEQNGVAGVAGAGAHAGGAHQQYRLAGFQGGDQTRTGATFKDDHRHRAALRVHARAGQRQRFGVQARAREQRRGRFEILQTEELAGLEAARGQRRAHRQLDNVVRQTRHRHDLGAEQV